MTYSQQIAANVRAEVARVGYTQKEIAQVLGLSSAVVSDRFNNKKPFQNDELMLIAKHLGIDVLTFYRASAAQEVAA